MHWTVYYQESPHQQLLPVFLSCSILSKHCNVWNSFALSLFFSLCRAHASSLSLSFALFRFDVSRAKQAHDGESLQLTQPTETTDVDATHSFLFHFYSSVSFDVLLSLSLSICTYTYVIDHSLDFVSRRRHRHSRSLPVSKQTYLNNKSSIIWYWSDCAREGKRITQVNDVIIRISISSHPGACIYVYFQSCSDMIPSSR